MQTPQPEGFVFKWARMRTRNTQSKSWKATHYREEQEFERKKTLARYFCRKSPALFATLAEWIAYKMAKSEADVKRMRKQLESKAAHKRSRITEIKAFQGKVVLLDNRSAVLAQFTIWCKQPRTFIREPAEWPTRRELQHDGNYKAVSEPTKPKDHRHLPLPRDPRESCLQMSFVPIRALPPLSSLDVVGALENEFPVKKQYHGRARMLLEEGDEKFWGPIHGIMEKFVNEIEEDIF